MLGASCQDHDECDQEYVCSEARCRPQACTGKPCAYVHPCARDEPESCEVWGARVCYSRDADDKGFCADYCSADQPCEAPGEGTATARCIKTNDPTGETLEVCALDCSAGMCPTGMDCRAVVEDGNSTAYCFPIAEM